VARISAGDIVAATLVQHPIRYVQRYVQIDDTKWDENANFIANARSDVPILLAEIRRIRQEVEGTAPERREGDPLRRAIHPSGVARTFLRNVADSSYPFRR